jgi:hypothetical protein
LCTGRTDLYSLLISTYRLSDTNVFKRVTNPESACSGETSFFKSLSNKSDGAAFSERLDIYLIALKAEVHSYFKLQNAADVLFGSLPLNYVPPVFYIPPKK